MQIGCTSLVHFCQMKELAFEIAKKIATDQQEDTIWICASILKKAFIMQGMSEKNANTMAIDSIKIILKAMVRVK